MTFKSLFWLSLAAVAIADKPWRETAEAKLPTSIDQNAKFQWTNSTAGNWYDVTDQDHINFSNGIAGWRVRDDAETEVLFHYARNVDFDGDNSPNGAELSVFVNFRVNTTYGDDNSQTFGNTLYYGDLGCAVLMSYSVVITNGAGEDSESVNGTSEMSFNLPEDVQKVTLVEVDRLNTDHQVATYTGDYLQITTKSKAPRIDANQDVQYHYCPEGSGWP